MNALTDASSDLKGRRIEVSREPQYHQLLDNNTSTAAASTSEAEEHKEEADMNGQQVTTAAISITNVKRGDLLVRLVTEATYDRHGNLSTPESIQDFVIDVAACSPLAESYRHNARRLAFDNNAASNMVEAIKYRKYSNEIAAMQQLDARFIPVVFNISGNPGLRFYQLLADLLNIHESTIFNIAGQLAIICAHYNALICEHYTYTIIQKFNTLQED
jgi:hypothetical protein